MVAQLPGVVPDGFAYLHASPETCARRMASTKRHQVRLLETLALIPGFSAQV